jgi:PhoD related phosphatase/WW domain
VGTSSPAQSSDGGRKASESAVNPYPDYHQQQWPAPSSGSAAASAVPTGLQPAKSGLSRLDSTASVMTTRATRGSPPPPETPIIPPPTNDIEARFAAAGFGRPTPAAAAAAPSAAAQQRTAQYSTPPPVQTTPQQSATTYQVPNEPRSNSRIGGSPPVQSSPPGTSVTSVPPVQHAEHALEQDFNRMNVHDEPPPSYASIQPSAAASAAYPNEKGRAAPIAQPTPTAASMTAAAVAGAAAAAAAAAPTGVVDGPSMSDHPAFQHDARMQQGQMQNQSPAGSSVAGPSVPTKSASPTPSQTLTSPPPLPEGWMAHLDPNSGQYYYIHIPTQSTQWEFPKGPTPLNLNEPLSPTGTFVNPIQSPLSTTFNKPMMSPMMSPTFSKPMMSPGFGPVPQSATIRPDGYYSMASIASPTAAGFTAPPPVSGLDMYNVNPSNGVYFGPYLRYTNMDIDQGVWLGSIMLITNTGQPPTIHLHQSVDLSPNPRQLKAQPIYSHQRWLFYRYDLDLQMEEEGTKWTYAVTSHLGCSRYEFLIAGRHETSWRFIAHSGNDFAMNVNSNERNKLGGVVFMWKDILQKHIECNGFHCQLGLGDQIFADRMWKELPLLKEWTNISGKENRKNAQWTTKHEDDVTHAYFHYYTSHFDQTGLREAWAQIPHVCTLDHHDM